MPAEQENSLEMSEISPTTTLKETSKISLRKKINLRHSQNGTSAPASYDKRMISPFNAFEK